MPTRAIVLAPLSVAAFYLAMAVLAFVRAPSMEAAWVFQAVGVLSVVAYLVFVPAGALVSLLYRGVGGPPTWACFAVGVVAATSAAIIADLPEPNFERWRYYGFSGFAGVLWAITFVKTK
jgi:hypothetical protein